MHRGPRLRVTWPTRHIVNEDVLLTRYDRWLGVEQKAAGEGIEPTPERFQMLAERNHCWRE